MLLDLRLPGIDGLEVLAQVRDTRPQLKVIVVTAVMSVRMAVEAMKHGAFDYLTKPFSGEELCLLIKAALRRDRQTTCAPGRGQSDPQSRAPAASVLLVGKALGLLVTLKLLLQRYGLVEVVVNTTLALRWFSQHLPSLVIVHESLLAADGPRLLHIVQSTAPTCPLLLISGRESTSPLTSELAAFPLYQLTDDADSFDRLVRELIELLATRTTPSVLLGPPLAFSSHIVKALSYIGAHYAEAIQVNTVAEAIGVSAGHLAHLFPAELRTTVKAYLTQVRIEVAKQLLHDRAYTLEHIAEKVGFSDASHLSRVFCRYAGYRPGGYRRHILRA
jgi:DNA-binding response OmpR family regulator/AraC-like DNA-binding protein